MIAMELINCEQHKSVKGLSPSINSLWLLQTIPKVHIILILCIFNSNSVFFSPIFSYFHFLFVIFAVSVVLDGFPKTTTNIYVSSFLGKML